MCGIFGILNKEYTKINYYNEFMKGKNRGPESSKFITEYMQMLLGFHRLAINGLNEESDQPLVFNDIVLICNGEIYNYKELYTLMNIKPNTGSDCEVIIHLYLKYGIEQTLIMLDGVFSFVLYDNRISTDLNNKVYVARDPYGVRPLYILKYIKANNFTPNVIGFASELKCLSDIYNKVNYNNDNYTLEQFTPGTYSIYNLSNQINSIWKPYKENIKYIIPHYSVVSNMTLFYENFTLYRDKIQKTLIESVYKRCLTTERPVACLLSGGLDSSLITALVNEYYIENGLPHKLQTYSIGLEGSEDLKYARKVADYLGTIHTEIKVTETEMFQIIPEVIKAIESYDTTTVRASIGNYLLGKYISTHSDNKVIFNGDGSDELFGGYLYMNSCPDSIEFDKETRRLLNDIHLFDVLRSDKCISSHGLEPRTPFLDKTFINTVLSFDCSLKNHNLNKNIEKYLLRISFNNCISSNGSKILPDEILWRKKEAFSDGVSTKQRSLFTILQEFIAIELNNTDINKHYLPCIETEKYYYKQIFNSFFPNCLHTIPYYWMPKFITSTDPSARTLELYDNQLKPF
jgi:asparagine synthase (glutamine-hydrolysing)